MELLRTRLALLLLLASLIALPALATPPRHVPQTGDISCQAERSALHSAWWLLTAALMGGAAVRRRR